MIPRLEAMRLIAQQPQDIVVITAMSVASEWMSLESDKLEMPMPACMGKASSLGLGLALACPERKFVVLDGDGSLLMNLGSLVTIAQQSPQNLVHFVFQNNMYERTGGQPIPGRDKLSFVALARGAGYPRTHEFEELAAFREHLGPILDLPGPTLVVLHVTPGPRKTFRRTRLALEASQELKAALAAKP